MGSSYLIRYGLWHQVGRFHWDSPDLRRGQAVVIRSHRGTELGEVLVRSESTPEAAQPAATPAVARVLRTASDADLEHARRLDRERSRRFELCQRVIRERNEAIELIDVEPLLDERFVVLHYLGPRKLDTAGLLAALRSSCDLEARLEFVGRDEPDEPETPTADEIEGGCGSGGDCGSCGSGGGCGTNPESSHGGCSDCGVKRLLASRRPLVAR